MDDSKVNVAAKLKNCPIMSFSFSTTYFELGSNQVGPSKGKEMSRETHLQSVESQDSVEQEEQPASPVTSSSFERQNVESSRSDGKDLPCDLQVLSTSSSDSSTDGDTDNSDSSKTAEEPADKS